MWSPAAPVRLGPWSLHSCPWGPGDLEVRAVAGGVCGTVGPVAAAQDTLLLLALFSSP